MDGKRSKFDYGWFFDGFSYNLFCANKDKYTLEEARALFESESCGEVAKEIKTAAVRFGAGVNDDGEKCVGWWMDEQCNGTEKRRCPVWVLK